MIIDNSVEKLFEKRLMRHSIDKQRMYLRKQIQNNKIKLKDVYCLLMTKPIKNRMVKQSERLHDKLYDVKMNSLAHMYLQD